MTVESANFEELRAIWTFERPRIDQLIQFKVWGYIFGTTGFLN
jgi:hypothetical protein